MDNRTVIKICRELLDKGYIDAVREILNISDRETLKELERVREMPKDFNIFSPPVKPYPSQTDDTVCLCVGDMGVVRGLNGKIICAKCLKERL